MSRRSALPGAAELFRATGDGRDEPRTDTRPERDDRDGPRPAAEPALALTVAPAPPAPAGELAPVSLEDTDGLEAASQAVRTSAARRRARAVAERRPSGRERHDEKITVYVSADELMDLEHARLALRGDYGLPVDRGRVVREALAVLLADFETKGEASILVRRLRGR